MKKVKFIFSAMMLVSSFFMANAQSGKELSDTKKQLSQILKANKQIEQNLIKFDTLDFVVYSKQEWKRLHESHAQNIKVTYPDGSVTYGLEDHIKQLKPMFTFAPDTKIKVHPYRFGSGKYTAVTGVIEGTFTQPMQLPNGTSIQPTGKSFKLPMCTIGIWENGVMIEEQLFWDNLAFMKQIGLAN